MHRSLQIREIVEIIFSHLSPLPEADSTDLTSLARTCTTFLGPALDLLWREQFTIVNILQGMPDYLWDIAHSEGKKPKVYLQRPIVETDWERARMYTHRVKIFSSNEPFDLSEVFEAFDLFLACLLPNLEQISWRCHSDDFTYIRVFLAPRLARIDIVGSLLCLIHLSFRLSQENIRN
ncbi:hypothetical protein B0H10DRAFT_300771 [Mycena sp. CBHHK59/15]|nr:hypothetical protein B0H10DRAFT_300771 [Mycena sp. CBHHK59/15]